jgi:uncharacterized protein (DUF1778 family)
MGRPKKPAKERRTERLEIVLSPAERRKIEAAARAVQSAPAIFVRDAALRMADGLDGTQGRKR